MSNSEPFDENDPYRDELEERIEQAVEEAGWDAFWAETLRAEAAEHGHAPTEDIRGVTVRVPQDLPLRYEVKAKRLKDKDDEAAFAELLKELFGADVLDAWRANGMGVREFKVILAWALSHGRGKPISFREAYDSVMSKDEDEDEGEDAEGKAPASKSAASGGTGRSSKRTSTASTGSRRKISRR